MGSPFRTGGCFPFLVLVAGCAAGCGQRAPIFPEHVDIPVAPAQAEPSLASPIEAQPNSPPDERTAPSPEKAPPEKAAPEPVVERVPEPAPEPVAAPAAPRPRAEALEVPPEVTAIVDAIDRYDSDRDLDAGRHPGELLAFLGLERGMHVGELFAGKGYTTELLARRVGPSGTVWAENPPALLKIVGRQYGERLGKTVMQSTNRVDQPADAPWPVEARNLDAVVSVLAYHDAVWLGVDRNAMNKAAFDALKKGGEYVVVDHSAAVGHGTSDAKTLHRIEEAVVVREVVSAGFQRADSAAFLRNPDDARDWSAAPAAAGDKRGTSDRFVLKFVRP
jgi:predicted methyltransferase